ncbi:transcription factor domain-containing protein [Zopfochytrium polystomum]|nr:transcription factor domain-containing protein [Zopfochytrium polystomum]
MHQLPTRPGADAREEDLLVDAFFHTVNMPMVIVHRASFMENYSRVPVFLKAAVCAMGASAPTFMSLPKRVMLYYYSIARSKALESCDAPSVENIQALLILSALSYLIGKRKAGRILLGMACGMVQYLRLDTDPDDLPNLRLTPIEKETRRRCWWTCYISERCESLHNTSTPT